MLTDTEGAEEEVKKVTKTRKHRSISRQHKLNRTPSSKKKNRSPPKKRSSSSKLTKEEIKYQRFVNGLKKDIQIYLNKSLRESRFDPRGTQSSQIDPTLIHKRVHEAKRLTAAVDAILTGPGLKTFYNQFLQIPGENSRPILSLRPLEESIVWPNEQE